LLNSSSLATWNFPAYKEKFKSERSTPYYQ